MWPDERIDDLARMVRDLTPLVADVARHDALIAQVIDRLDGIDTAIANIDATLTKRIEEVVEAQSEFREEYRANREEDQIAQARRTAEERKQRGAIIISLAGVFVPVFVALIYVAAYFLSNGMVEVPKP